MKRLQFFTKKTLISGLLVLSALTMPLSAMAANAPAIPEKGLVLREPQKQEYITDKIYNAFHPAPCFVIPAYKAPDGYTFEQFKIGNVPVERFAAENPETERVLLQMHGGGYVLRMTNGHRILGAKQVQLTVTPDYQYPAALEDAVTVYRGLLERGVKPENIMLTGDSAGGNLALELALYLKENKLPQPAVIMLASPWTTFEHKKGTSRYFNEKKDQVLGLGTPLYKPVKDVPYAGKVKRKDPRISPVHADLKGLPPLLIQTGGNELFLTENVALAKKAAEDGVEVTLSVYAGMPHDFALMLPDMDESVNSLKEIREFANRYMK